MRQVFKILVTLAATLSVATANADVIFRDDYTSRATGSDIWGSLPTTTSPGLGVYGSVLTFPYSGKIDPYTPMGKALKFDTSTGDDTQMAYVPYNYVFSDPAFANQGLQVSLRAAFPTGRATGSTISPSASPTSAGLTAIASSRITSSCRKTRSS